MSAESNKAGQGNKEKIKKYANELMKRSNGPSFASVPKKSIEKMRWEESQKGESITDSMFQSQCRASAYRDQSHAESSANYQDDFIEPREEFFRRTVNLTETLNIESESESRLGETYNAKGKGSEEDLRGSQESFEEEKNSGISKNTREMDSEVGKSSQSQKAKGVREENEESLEEMRKIESSQKVLESSRQMLERSQKFLEASQKMKETGVNQEHLLSSRVNSQSQNTMKGSLNDSKLRKPPENNSEVVRSSFNKLSENGSEVRRPLQSALDNGGSVSLSYRAETLQGEMSSSSSFNPINSIPPGQMSGSLQMTEGISHAKERVKEFLRTHGESSDPLGQEATEVIMLLMKFYQVHMAKLGDLIVKKEEESRFFEMCLFESNQKLIQGTTASKRTKELLEDAQEELEDLHIENKELKKQMVEQQTLIELLKRENQAFRSDANTKESPSQKETRETSNQANEALLKTLQTVQRKNEVLSEEVEKLMREIEKRDEEIVDLDKKVGESHYRIMDLESTAAQLKNELLDARSRLLDMQQMAKENQDLRQEVISFKGVNLKLQESLEKLIGELCEKKYQILQLSQGNFNEKKNERNLSGSVHASKGQEGLKAFEKQATDFSSKGEIDQYPMRESHEYSIEAEHFTKPSQAKQKGGPIENQRVEIPTFSRGASAGMMGKDRLNLNFYEEAPKEGLKGPKVPHGPPSTNAGSNKESGLSAAGLRSSQVNQRKGLNRKGSGSGIFHQDSEPSPQDHPNINQYSSLNEKELKKEKDLQGPEAAGFFSLKRDGFFKNDQKERSGIPEMFERNSKDFGMDLNSFNPRKHPSENQPNELIRDDYLSSQSKEAQKTPENQRMKNQSSIPESMGIGISLSVPGGSAYQLPLPRTRPPSDSPSTGAQEPSHKKERNFGAPESLKKLEEVPKPIQPKRVADVTVMPSDQGPGLSQSTVKSLESDLASMLEQRKKYELQLQKMPSNPKKAKEREAKEKLEEEVDRVSGQINSLRLRMKKLHVL